ncbi:MAG: (2Fe-2S) ferredoxin domain-containing protein [Lentisphaerae bacterium]|nr:(2Fe-2S) ferredoxin domain-containing protein [Lentisphaerota bacterium]
MKSLDELRKIRDQVRQELELRSGRYRAKVVVCMGTCGIAAGARETMKALLDALAAHQVTDVAVVAAGCRGFCEQEPLVEVQVGEAPAVTYGHVDAAAAARIVAEHLVGGRTVQELVFR